MKSPWKGFVWLAATLLAPPLARAAAAIDESKLPSPATQKVDFARDIKPIFQEICLRCHGPERPKSGFRLTDRASALKGGEHGIDIIPGKSAKSPLIHYVARLVEDMEMPPMGKGPPLTSNQVALLRAWIDQGAAWDTAGGKAQVAPSVEVAPTAGWTGVHGDEGKFRELEWRPEGWNGGAESFQLREQFPDGRAVSVEGHALRDDYKLTLDLRKPDLGFARLGFEQFRKYYDNAGGYYAPFTPPLYRLGQDLYLDNGRAWAEVGLTLPNWPRIVAGYEYQYRDGSKSMLSWGPVNSPSGNYLDTRSIYPSVENIDEHAHILHLDISYDLRGFVLEDNLRAELGDLKTRRLDALNVPSGALKPDLVTLVQEGTTYTQVANTARVQKEIAPWWLASGGYRYGWYDGDASFLLTPQDGQGRLAAGDAWSAPNIVLGEVSQVANVNSQFLPLPQLTATLGLQAQWSHQDAFGDANLDQVLDPADPTAGVFRYPALDYSQLDQTTVEESFLTRYTGLPFTALYGEARLKQEDYTRLASQVGGFDPFLVDEDAKVRWVDCRVGFNSSPWRVATFGVEYRYRDRQTDYTYPQAVHAVSGLPGYPGFILARDILADEVRARLVLRPATWFKTTLTYTWGNSDYNTTTAATLPSQVGSDATPGGTILAGHYLANTVSANATFIPHRRLSLTGTFSYQNSTTTTADHGDPSVAPYRGDLWSLMASASYVLDDKTDLVASYLYSQARYGQNNAAAGLPLGIDYDRQGLQVGLVRRCGRNVTLRLLYGYFAYHEPTSGNLTDYTAQQVFGVMTFRWPN